MMVKRLLAFFSGLIISFVPFRGTGQVYIAVNGNDTAAGTITQPKATLHAALRQVRELRRLNDPIIKNGIHVIVRGGSYFLNEPVFIRPEDAGTPESPTIIEAAVNEQPVFSGGAGITGWKRLTKDPAGLPKSSKGKIWVTTVPAVDGNELDFRQLWVNGTKAVRAKDTKGILMNRILSWNKKTGECWIPTPATNDISKLTGLEMFIHQWWEIAILRISKIEVHGDSTKLSFHQPESRIQNEHPWPAPWISKETGNSAFYLTDAIQFLNEPGEWFLDKKNQRLYYYPRDKENMLTATVVAPYLETLVKIEGTIDHPVSNILFKGISFQHTGWLRPSRFGHVPHQAGMYMLDAYKLKKTGTADKKSLENQAWVGRPTAAVEVAYSTSTVFENCRFEHMAATGLDYKKGNLNDTIQGNIFKDIGGTALLAGIFSDEAVEIHLPYNPKDEREITTGTFISNNLITDATNEDWGSVGIGAGYVRGITIAHNDISNVSYSGISMGWGWTKTPNAMKNNTIFANKITHYAKHNYDAAGIYTLSAQPGSVINENYIDSIYKAPYAHIPGHWFYLYTDEGSSQITVKDNWCPAEKFLQNANGPGNLWQNNGPMVDGGIKRSAGLLPSFNYLLKDKNKADHQYKINEDRPAVIELIAAAGQTINIDSLKNVLKKNNINPASLYQWENHYVIFEKMPDVFVLRDRLLRALPGATIKIYHDNFYEFNRKYCGNNCIVKEWDHILLTANLVDNPTLQNEYLNLHATQFEKWPEVAKGFCNAGFQQLLIYKNGRQLVLVISIPKGESLDKLNPKTTENNPRVTEWNNLMKKYQEGIHGTKKGDVWVFLKPVQ